MSVLSNAIKSTFPADLPASGRLHVEANSNLDLGPTAANPNACLGPTDVIDSTSPIIKELAERLTAGLQGDGPRAAALFRWVRDEIRYDFTPVMDSRAVWLASATVTRGKGFCQQKAVLLVALARAVGIPAGTVFQHLADWKLRDSRYEAALPGGVIIYHGLCALWWNGAWHALDPSLDSELCARRRYQVVEVDAHTGLTTTGSDALLPLNDLDGHRHFDILGQTAVFADVPVVISDLLVAFDAQWAEVRQLAQRTGVTM